MNYLVRLLIALIAFFGAFYSGFTLGDTSSAVLAKQLALAGSFVSGLVILALVLPWTKTSARIEHELP